MFDLLPIKRCMHINACAILLLWKDSVIQFCHFSASSCLTLSVPSRSTSQADCPCRLSQCASSWSGQHPLAPVWSGPHGLAQTCMDVEKGCDQFIIVILYNFIKFYTWDSVIQVENYYNVGDAYLSPDFSRTWGLVGPLAPNTVTVIFWSVPASSTSPVITVISYGITAIPQ